jgi:hypothetical protein
MILRQQFVEYVGPKLINALRKTEKRYFIEIPFQANCHHSYLKT